MWKHKQPSYEFGQEIQLWKILQRWEFFLFPFCIELVQTVSLPFQFEIIEMTTYHLAQIAIEVMYD